MTLPRQGYFNDREHAAERLADALMGYRGQNPLILAIPRGGVPIGRLLADRLGGELDVVLVRKLGAPGHEEFAIGAVDEAGNVQLADYAGGVGADAAYVEREAARQRALIAHRRELYSPHRQAVDPAGRVTIVVDDGLATGFTMRAALTAVRAHRPAHLVCAVPVASPRSLAETRALCDDIVCLAAPHEFMAVSQYYGAFPPVEDDEVVGLLSRARPPAGSTMALAVRIPVEGLQLQGDLHVPAGATGLVVFAHGSGSSRLSPRNRQVAQVLQRHGLATLLFDLLAEEEDVTIAARFDIGRLAARLEAAVDWATRQPPVARLPLGLFGASTGAAAALIVAARLPRVVKAVVSRGGRPDLAGHAVLDEVRAPTMLIVGSADTDVVALNKSALASMSRTVELVLVPGATHLFEEPGTLERVAELASGWFMRWLT
jgi:putative phosphoribosyl transferase